MQMLVNGFKALIKVNNIHYACIKLAYEKIQEMCSQFNLLSINLQKSFFRHLTDNMTLIQIMGVFYVNLNYMHLK